MADEKKLNLQAALAANNMTAVSSTTESEEKKDKDVAAVDFKMVSFSLAGKDYAIDIMKVKEIVKANLFTYVPNTMPFVRGVFNLRGEIIPIIDLRIFFNIEVEDSKPDKLENLLVVTIADQMFGVVVDAIDKVVGIQKSSIQPPHPLFGDINIKYIYGVVENRDRLYVLLDVDKILGARTANDVAQSGTAGGAMKQMSMKKAKVVSAATSTKQMAAPAKEMPKEKDIDTTFIVEGLKNLKKFNVSQVNDAWVKGRISSWSSERGKDKMQLQNEADADAFLKPFYSRFTGTWWSKEYADAVYKALPDNTAKQISVWNPGCGKGFEAFSLACLLSRRYPEAKIRIYAQDVDLISVSNASLVTLPKNIADGWYAPYVTKKITGEYTFTQNIKDAVLFEYHDCVNTNALPACDIIFMRDVLSFLPQESLNVVFADFEDRLKGNGIVFVGENESISSLQNFGETMVGQQVIYKKQ